MSIPTEEQHINGHTWQASICKGCRLDVTHTEIGLNGIGFALCRRCARSVVGWLSADLAVGCRQRGDFEGDFEQVERVVRTNLQMLELLGVRPSDEELASLMEYAREKS